MIGLTEKILYLVKQDHITLQSSGELKEYLVRNNLMDKFLKVAGEDINFMLSRVFDVVNYCYLKSL